MRRVMSGRGLGCGGALVLLLATACGKPPPARPAPPPREVEVLTLAPTEVRETGEYLGSLFSRQSVNVLPQVAGYVKKIHVRPGQRVAAGDPLAEIDSRQEAAALDSAEAQRRSAAARVSLARQTLARTEALFKEGLVSGQERDRVAAEVAAAEAGASGASAEVSARQVQLQFHAVRAAVPGVVGDIPIRLGDFVTASTQLMSIAQADVLELSIAIPASRARTLKPQTPVELLGANGEVIGKSTVFFIAPEANPRTQLVEVKAIFQNEQGLRPSELVRARLVYGIREALQLPALSVARQSGQAFAYVVQKKEGKTIVERRPVTLGALGASSYVIEQGLVAGDAIAVSSLQMLRDGAEIVPRPVTATSPPRGNAQGAP